VIENTGVRSRYFVQPIEETPKRPGFEERNKIDVIIYVSCTGFMVPSHDRLPGPRGDRLLARSEPACPFDFGPHYRPGGVRAPVWCERRRAR
jgi:hypothetical protein